MLAVLWRTLRVRRRFVVPQGAFYVFPIVKRFFGRRARSGKVIASAADLCLELLAQEKVRPCITTAWVLNSTRASSGTAFFERYRTLRSRRSM